MKTRVGKSNNNSLKPLGVTLLLSSTFLLASITSIENSNLVNNPLKVYAVMESDAEDPSIGTASKEIETAIAKGKEFIGKDYAWGGGHGDYPDCNGGGLDCSGFVRQAYLQGIGIDIGGETTHSLAVKFSKYIISGDKADRGDLLFDESKGHIVILLDQESWTHIGSDGGVSGAFCTIDPAGGVRISHPYWEGSASQAIDMSAVIEDGFLPVDESAITALTGGSVSGKEESTKEETATGDQNAWKNPLVVFNDKKVVSKVNGLIKGDEFSGETIYLADTLSTKFFELTQKLMLALGIIFFSFSAIMTVIYLAILPRSGSTKLNDYYEKVSGHTSVVDRKGTIDTVLSLGISVIFLGIVATNSHMVILGIFYNAISNILSFII